MDLFKFWIGALTIDDVEILVGLTRRLSTAQSYAFAFDFDDLKAGILRMNNFCKMSNCMDCFDRKAYRFHFYRTLSLIWQEWRRGPFEDHVSIWLAKQPE